jgi:methyl-accepting chemotaxis protein
MKRFSDLKIGTKLLVGFLIVAVLAAVVGYVGILNLNAIKSSDHDLYAENVSGLDNAGFAALYFQNVRFSVLQSLTVSDAEQRNECLDGIQSSAAKVDEYLKAYEKGIVDEQDSQLFSKMKTQWGNYNALVANVINYERAGKNQQVRELVYGELTAAGEPLRDGFNNLMAYNAKGAKDRSNANIALADRAEATMIAVIIIAMLVAILLGVFLSRMIGRPIAKMLDAAEKLAKGDVEVSVQADSKDEIGTLASSFGLMIDNIKQQASVVENIAAGDLSFDLSVKSDKDVLNLSLAKLRQTLKDLISEMHKLADAAEAGNLSLRGDVQSFQGDYQEIVGGVNQTLDVLLQPIGEATLTLEEVAKGNLQVSMEGAYKGDHAVIKNSVNNTVASFNEVLGDINAAAEQVSAGAKQVSESSMVLSQGATEQASSIEELTSSVEEISSQTKLNAQNATQASDLAAVAKTNAEAGNGQMQAMLTAMQQINDSSTSISKIIKVIDDIAFQTNILALNAAVEAARAGQHGKGFAVVAEEVRNLAARSADAAKETTEMIEDSIKKVEGGTKIANKTAEELGKIVEAVAKAASLVGDIAAASNEQAAGIEQINQGIMQVSQVVQTNSATSEEGAAASEELASQAALLREAVGQFKIKNAQKQGEDKGTRKALTVEKKKEPDQSAAAKKEAAAASQKINLSDKEFGKY